MSTTSKQKLLQYAGAMGMDVYVKRSNVGLPAAGNITIVSDRKDLKAKWEPLLKEMQGCQACKLHVKRNSVVSGTGSRKATWMIVGEAPGREEDLRGEPFVGRAGKLLDAMLSAIHLDRQCVYITNTVKCRPPDNRNPTREELQACHGFLVRQVELVSPKILLALGKVAANTLLVNDNSIGSLRGTSHTFADTGIPLVVSYHPAYLLRQPERKRAAWEDLKLAVRLVGEAVSNQD